MTSNFVGLLELYHATSEDAYLQPVLRAWNDIVTNRLYLTGSASWGELDRRDHLLRADGRVGEGCVTTTWMQMNLRLLELTGEAKYADELERTIYNALTAAQHPESRHHLLLPPTRWDKAVRDGEPGRARRELLHVERAARPDAGALGRVGRARQRRGREPLRPRRGAADARWRRGQRDVGDALPDRRRRDADARRGRAGAVPVVRAGPPHGAGRSRSRRTAASGRTGATATSKSIGRGATATPWSCG